MTSSSRRTILACVIFVGAPLLCAATVAQAAQCRGNKTIQNCVMYHADGTWYASDPSVPAAYTSCQPLTVPCDYPDNIFDAISKIFTPQQ